MAGKITNDGLTHVGQLTGVGLGGPVPTHAFGHIEIGTGSTAPTVTDAGVETALASGGRRAVDSGYPVMEYPETGPELVVKATFPAGSFTTGTAITEAAWVTADGSKCAGRIVFASSRNPSASEPLDATLRFPLSAG